MYLSDRPITSPITTRRALERDLSLSFSLGSAAADHKRLTPQLLEVRLALRERDQQPPPAVLLQQREHPLLLRRRRLLLRKVQDQHACRSQTFARQKCTENGAIQNVENELPAACFRSSIASTASATGAATTGAAGMQNGSDRPIGTFGLPSPTLLRNLYSQAFCQRR